MSGLAYRKDIDGLRAIAVLLVIAYHLGVAPFGGGFIGVDLFFVISGFLIASIFDRHPTITLRMLATFYRRRIQRLLPAFVVVAIVTTVVATGLLLPEDFDEYLKSLRESFLFRANVYFARATTGYFATTTAALPWLHTWSLSVEWQFYLVFPLAMWLVRLWPSRAAQRWLLLATTLVGVALSISITTDRREAAYFSATARFFEFTLGALAAWLDTPVVRERTAKAISAFCVVALLALAMIFTHDTHFPGVNAAAACLPGFVLLVIGRSASILSSEAAAFVGRRSYSAYLWHWPIVAFLAYVQYAPGPFEIVALVVGVLVLADVTYRLVERPGVAARWTLPTVFASCCVVPLVASAGAYALVVAHDGFPERLGSESSRVYADLKRFESPRDDRCHGAATVDLASCVLGDAQGRATALLIGDSHARHLEPFVDVLARQAHVKVFGVTKNLCLALDGARLPPEFPEGQQCRAAVERNAAWIRTLHFDYVVIGERWTAYPIDSLRQLDTMLQAIERAGSIPVLVKSSAEDGSNPKDCSYRRIKLRRPPLADDCSIAAAGPRTEPTRPQVDALIDSMQALHPALRIVDPQAVQCERGRCVAVIDDTPIYSDTHHLNAFGSTMLGRAYLARLGNPFGP